MGKYKWRAVCGYVESLANRTLRPEILEEFLAQKRVIARAKAIDETTYMLEVAVVGRRRRVAVLRDDETVAPGMHLADLVEELAKAGLGVKAHVLEAQSFGDPDIGAFDVAGELAEEDFLAVGSEPIEQLSVEDLHYLSAAKAVSSKERQERISITDEHYSSDDRILSAPNWYTRIQAASGESAGEHPMIKWKSKRIHPHLQGPYLYISDLPLAAMPGEAANARVPLAVLDTHNVRAVVGQEHFNLSWRKFDSQSFYLRLAGVEEGCPELILRDSETVRRCWSWFSDLDDTDFTVSHETARLFAKEHFGAAAMARAIVEVLPYADETEVHAALLCGPGVGPALLLQALGLSTDVLAALVGLTRVEEIAGAHIFDKYGFTQALRQGFRYGAAGYGKMPEFWQFYRKVAVENPWILRTIMMTELGVAAFLALAGGAVARAGTKTRKIIWSLAILGVADFALQRVFARVVRHELKAANAEGLQTRE